MTINTICGAGTGTGKGCKVKHTGCVPVIVWDCKDAQKACTVVLHEGWLYGVEVDTPANEAGPLGHDNYTKAMTFDKAVVWLSKCQSGTTTDTTDTTVAGKSTTADEACGRRITTDDGESTLITRRKYIERTKIPLLSNTSFDSRGDGVHEVISDEVQEPLIIKKSDICGACDSDGLEIEVEANADIALAAGAPATNGRISYTLTSGYGVDRDGDTTTVGASDGDTQNRSESHIYKLPWDENGEIAITPIYNDFSPVATIEDGFLTLKVWALECLYGDF